MSTKNLGLMALGILGAASLALAGEGNTDEVVAFAAPVRIAAGDTFLGEGRYFPSPVLHDLDGDGAPEVLVGDLRGIVTFASRTKHGVSAETPVLRADGQPLKFHNW